MKIQRAINGQIVEIELTAEELYGAYLEKEHEYDCRDIQDKLEYYNLNDETRQDFFDMYGISLNKVFGNEELINELAYEARHNQDHYGMEWTYARDDAFKDVLAQKNNRASLDSKIQDANLQVNKKESKKSFRECERE